MNHCYLMKHISYHLHTYVQRFSTDFSCAESFCGRIRFQDRFTPDELMSFFTARKDMDLESPVFLSFNQQVVYAFVPVPGHYFIIGPVRFSDEVYLRYQEETRPADNGWLQTVPVCTFKDLASDTLLIFNLYQEEQLDESDLVTENCIRQETDAQLQAHFSELVFENREQGRRHNPYDQEFRECASIEHGDLEQLKRAIKEDYLGELGTLAKNPIRHTRNLGIVVITLASRAAIRGGLPYEIAYSLSDSSIQKLEKQ